LSDGGNEGVHDESAGVGRPGNDLDLLLAELRGDRPLTHTVSADARALRIDVTIGRVDGDLGPAAGVTGDRADHDLAALHLPHLLLDEPLDKLRMGSRHHDNGVRSLAPAFDDDHLDVIADGEALA